VAKAATVLRVVSVAHRLSRDSSVRVRTDFSVSDSGTAPFLTLFFSFYLLRRRRRCVFFLLIFTYLLVSFITFISLRFIAYSYELVRRTCDIQ